MRLDGLSGVSPMEFVTSFENNTRRIRTAIHFGGPNRLHPSRPGIRQNDTARNPSKMRLQVLRRDHYRCRSCDQTGDEITLEVRPIRPGASSIEELLTLCAHCRNLVEQWNITASRSPEFLQHLRCQLCSATETQSQFLATEENEDSSGNRT